MSVNSRQEIKIINKFCLQDDCNCEKKQFSEKFDQNHPHNDMTSANIYRLNNDCLIHIFHYLSVIDRIKIERVCKWWKEVSQKSWHNVKKLDLRNSTWGFSSPDRLKQIDTIILHNVLSRCGKFLNEIHLAKVFSAGKEDALFIISQSCPNVQVLDISHLVVQQTKISSLIDNCHNIRELSLNCVCLLDHDLEKLFKVNQKLKCLKLVDTEITGKCLMHLPSKTMQEIIIEQCDYVHDNNVAEAITQLKNLKTLIINECCDVWKQTTEAVGKYCPNLETLEIIGKSCMLQFNGISCITSLSKLTNLKVSAYWFICNSILCKLGLHCQQLVYLDLSDVLGHFITDHALATIQKFPKLEILITRHLYQVTSNGLMHLNHLKQLVCQECHFFDITVSNLIHHSFQMELLDLSGCYNITNATLRRAATATKCRTNNIILKLCIGGTAVDLVNFTDVSPFLQIIDKDLRYRKIFPLHPDFLLN